MVVMVMKMMPHHAQIQDDDDDDDAYTLCNVFWGVLTKSGEQSAMIIKLHQYPLLSIT